MQDRSFTLPAEAWCLDGGTIIEALKAKKSLSNLFIVFGKFHIYKFKWTGGGGRDDDTNSAI